MPLSGSASTDGGLLRLALIVALPILGVTALVLLARWWTGQGAIDRWARRRRSHPVVAPAPRRPVELVAADLRRLGREVALVPSGTPVARRRGLLAAYDDVLCEAADLLEVTQQLTTQPLSGREMERLRVLDALRQAGMVVSG